MPYMDAKTKEKFERHFKNYLYKYSVEFSRLDQDDLFKIFLNEEYNGEGIWNKLEGETGRLNGKTVLDIGSGPEIRSISMLLRGAKVIGIELLREGVEVSLINAGKYPGLKTNFL